MRVWHESVSPKSAEALVFDAAEVGEPNLGHIVETRLVQSALLDVAEQAGVQIVGAEFASLSINEDDVHIETTSGALATRLVVGADGAHSAVRASIGRVT
jgi:2-octaprenylphenol hydroxylase